MNITDISTNNFYKFISILGVYLISITYFIPLKDLNEIGIETVKIEGEMRLCNLQDSTNNIAISDIRNDLNSIRKDFDENFKKDYEVIDSESEKNEILDKLKDKEYREYMEFIYNYNDYIIPQSKELKEIQIRLSDLNDKILQNENNRVGIENRRLLIKEYLNQHKRLIYINTIGFGLGLFLLLFGLYKWYKNQSIIDK